MFKFREGVGQNTARGGRKSSFTQHTGCVECKPVSFVEIRDSKRNGVPSPEPRILVPADVWMEFLNHCLNPDSPRPVGAPSVYRGDNGSAIVRDANGTELSYHVDEWDAFIRGAKNAEFDFAKEPDLAA